jgi:hypothetical protein
VGHSKGRAERKVDSHECLQQKIREISNKQDNDTLQSIREEEANLKTNGWKEIIKIRAEINEMQTQRTTQRTNETKLVL